MKTLLQLFTNISWDILLRRETPYVILDGEYIYIYILEELIFIYIQDGEARCLDETLERDSSARNAFVYAKETHMQLQHAASGPHL